MTTILYIGLAALGVAGFLLWKSKKTISKKDQTEPNPLISSNPPVALQWVITVNTPSDLDISGMEISGASVLAITGSFPVTNSGTVEGTTQTITTPGIYTLKLVGVTSGLSGQSITVIDSNGISQNQAVGSISSGDVTFTNVYMDKITKVQIIGNI